MRVDLDQLVVVVLVGGLERRVLIVHATHQQGTEILVLMTETEVVPELLARHALLPGMGVVKIHGEIGVVQLAVAPQDMAAAICADAGNAQPTR